MSLTTPLMLTKDAKTWEEFYVFATKPPHQFQKLLPGMYCLFISLELRLKAYIVLLDKSFAQPKKLRSLGHDFKKIYKIIYSIAPSDKSIQIQKALKSYNLFNNNINDLRYPESPRGLQIDKDLEEGNHNLRVLFETIDSEVKNGMTTWLNQ